MISTVKELIRNSPLAPYARWALKIYRSFFFRRTIKRLLNDPRCSLSDRKILAELSYGWSNERYSAGIEYLSDCVEYAARSKLPILECGSGLTTIVVGLVAQKSGNTVWSLEHDESWYKTVRKYLKKYRIESVNLHLCPSTPFSYGDYSWYDAPLESMPDRFALVICDGYPGMDFAGQYSLFPVMKERFMPGCIILFDHAFREKGHVTMNYWANKLNMKYEVIRGDKKSHYLITFPDIEISG
jgi:hypothetical protein